MDHPKTTIHIFSCAKLTSTVLAFNWPSICRCRHFPLFNSKWELSVESNQKHCLMEETVWRSLPTWFSVCRTNQQTGSGLALLSSSVSQSTSCVSATRRLNYRSRWCMHNVKMHWLTPSPHTFFPLAILAWFRFFFSLPSPATNLSLSDFCSCMCVCL